MNAITSAFDFRRSWPAWLLDGIALLAIYFIPTLSHMVGIPFYLFEPMRIFVILSVLHSNRMNSYLIAIGLPLFSFMISSHPVLIKALLIGFELLVNVYLFFFAKRRIASHWAILLSVIFSKIIYYLIKYVLIHFAFLESSLISTPLYFQIFTTMAFGLYAYIWFRKSLSSNKDNN